MLNVKLPPLNPKEQLLKPLRIQQYHIA